MSKYTEYADKVLSGEIVANKYIRQACKRYLDFFDKYDFRPDKVDRVVNFISKLKHYTGSHNRKPFILLPFQFWIICAIFGFYRKGTDKRVTRNVYIEIARKNGKSAFVAAIQLYMLIADGESGAEVINVANSAKQAKILFQMASTFLSGIDPKGKWFKRFRDSIKFDKTHSVLHILSSDSSTGDGYNPSSAVLDEVHSMPDSQLYDVLISGQGMRTSPLVLCITTAGFNKFGFCYGHRDTFINILSGNIEDDSMFGAIYTLDDDDDWADPKVWIKANPSLGVTVQEDYLQDQVQKAKNNTSLEVGVRTKNFNQWVSTQDIWISNDLLLDSTQSVDLNDFKDCMAYVGVDLASVSDLTAISWLVVKNDVYFFKTLYYLPQTALENNSNCELYKDWKRKGFLTITPGNVTDYDYILNDLIRSSEIVPIQSVAYDAYNSVQWAISATEQNLSLEPYSQALWNFNRPTKEFERLIKSGKVVIDNNPITRYCFSNVSLKYDHNDNCKPVKLEAMQKIDGVISMLEALGRYLEGKHWDNSISY